MRIIGYDASGKAAPLTPAKAYCGTPSNEETDPTFCSAANQTPDSRLITLLCGWYRPLCHCHQDRPTGSNRDQKIGLEQLHLPTDHFPLESPYTVPDRSWTCW